MSVTEAINKIYNPKQYDEVMTDLIHGWCWRKVVEKNLQNLENQ